MAFVPYVPPRTPSPRAQEIGQRLALTIAEFQQKYPDLSEEEVRQALALASERSPERARPARAAIAAAVAAFAGVMGVGVFLSGNRVPSGTGAVLPVIIAVGAALLAVMAARRRRE